MVHDIFTMTLTFKPTRVSGEVRVTKVLRKGAKKTPLVSVPFISYTPVCRHFLSHVVLGSWYLPLQLPTNEQKDLTLIDSGVA